MIPEKKIKLVEKEIQNKCPKCLGKGCSECKGKMARIKLYAMANIPMDYWFLPFKDFQGDVNFKGIIDEKLNAIDTIYENGNSMAFVGNFGTGKTYAACCVLKKALAIGYTAKYFHMSEIINALTSVRDEETDFLKSLINIDFLVIDEFCRRYIFASEKAEQLFGQNLEYILRTRFQNRMPTILCSNNINIDDVLSEDFAEAFSSLRSKYVEIIYVSGTDFRKLEK